MSESPLVNVVPHAVRAKEAARLAGIGHSLLYARINSGLYESYLDGSNRMVVVESILAHQRKLAKEQPSTPATQPAKGRLGRPRKTDRTT